MLTSSHLQAHADAVRDPGEPAHRGGGQRLAALAGAGRRGARVLLGLGQLRAAGARPAAVSLSPALLAQLSQSVAWTPSTLLPRPVLHTLSAGMAMCGPVMWLTHAAAVCPRNRALQRLCSCRKHRQHRHCKHAAIVNTATAIALSADVNKAGHHHILMTWPPHFAALGWSVPLSSLPEHPLLLQQGRGDAAGGHGAGRALHPAHRGRLAAHPGDRRPGQPVGLGLEQGADGDTLLDLWQSAR